MWALCACAPTVYVVPSDSDKEDAPEEPWLLKTVTATSLDVDQPVSESERVRPLWMPPPGMLASPLAS